MPVLKPQQMPPRSHPATSTVDYPYENGSHLPDGFEANADVVVIGAGPGGAATAYHLVEQGLDVLLLDAGPAFKTSDFSQDLGQAYTQLYAEGGVATTDLPPFIPLFRAEGLGGGTLVNSGLCFEPKPNVLENWMAQSGVRWFDQLDEEYAWVKEYMMIGPNDEAVLGRNNTILRDAANAKGWESGVAPRNAPTCIGCGVCNMGCPSGGKRSADVSYVRDATQRGLRVITNARVGKLDIHKGKVKSVKGQFVDANKRQRDARFTIRSSIVVLAAGALVSPIILAKSGYKNKHLGLHLHGHPGIAINGWHMDEAVNQWDGVTQGFYVDQKSDEGLLIETTSLPAIAMSSAFAPFGKAGHEYMRDYRHMSTIGGMIHDEGEGYVKLGFGGRVTRRYVPAESDFVKFRNGLAHIADLYESIGVTKFQASINGTPIVSNRKELDKIINSLTDLQQILAYISHAHGTCRMDVNEKNGVVGADFKVHGLDNCYISDASVFPATLGVNPQWSIMAFSRKFSQILSGRFTV